MRSLVALWLSVGLLACSSGSPEDLSANGKGDDFFAVDAKEFVVSGRASVTIEADLSDATPERKMARVKELVYLKHISYAYFLTSYFIEKEKASDSSWGGMGGMAKAGSYVDFDIKALDERTYEFTFEQVVASHVDLLTKLNLPDAPNGGKLLALEIGNPSNEELALLDTDKEWFRRAPWKDWNPAERPAASKELMEMTIRPEEATSDAWLDFNRLFADNKLTIDLHFGYDYHSQYHRKHAKEVYEWLQKDLGFASPVSRWDDYTHTTGPLTASLAVEDREVAIEVRIYYGKDGSPTDPKTDAGGKLLEDNLRKSFAEADVILFSGHAGPFYGLSMADWKVTAEGDLSYKEIEGLNMPQDRYQLVLADGCDTYQIAAGFARNPNKLGGKNIDVITTTSYGDAELPYSAMNMLLHLMATDPQGYFRPYTVKQLLRDLRSGHWTNPLFGIHFVNDNPTLHPLAKQEWTCTECTEHFHCASNGNRCTTNPELGGRFCVMACTDDGGCPNGMQCERIAAANAMYDLGCVPANQCR